MSASKMTPQEIDRLRQTARRAGRLESILMEVADRAGVDCDRLMGEVVDLAYSVVVALPPLPSLQPRQRAPSPCVACLAADAGLDEAAGFEPDGTVRT
jgi:hypothetical protein